MNIRQNLGCLSQPQILSSLWQAVFLLIIVGFTQQGHSQDPNLLFTLSNEVAVENSQSEVRVLFDNLGTNDVEGWSFGVCHNVLELNVLDVVAGSTTLTVNDGDAPGFESINVVTGNGFTVGVVVDLFGTFKLAPGIGMELNIVTYQVVASAGSTADVCFCNTLGSPPVSTVCVIAAASVVPMAFCGSIESVEGPALFSFNLSDAETFYDPPTGMSTIPFTVEASIVQTDDNMAPVFTQAFSMGVTPVDPFLELLGVELADVIETINGGAGPDFYSLGGDSPGLTIGIVYSFFGFNEISYEIETVVFEATYRVNSAGLVGVMDPQILELAFVNTLGIPPVANVIVVGGASLAPERSSGSINLIPQVDLPHIRGDCNGDTTVNVADSIWMIQALFNNGPSGGCFDSCDSNGDVVFDQSDVVFLLNYRFSNGTPPPAPFPDCDMNPGSDCEVYGGC